MAKNTKQRHKLVDRHYKLSMNIALQAVRIQEMKKVLASQSDELLQVEAELERLEAEANGSGLN